MILLIEANRLARKRLSDLVSRERIIGVDSVPQVFEMVCKFRNNFDLIISNIRLIKDLLLKGTLSRLCEKLDMKVPPVLIYYNKGDEWMKKEFAVVRQKHKIIEYDKNNSGFPLDYISAIEELYPDVITDIKEATEIWSTGDEGESAENIRKWLVEEGFLEAIASSQIGKLAHDIEQIIPVVKRILLEEQEQKEMLKEGLRDTGNYRQKYFELKRKHEELLKFVDELIEYSKEHKRKK